MTFPIEEGVVEITAEIDRNSIRASAAAAGKTAGDELEKSTRDSFDKSTSGNRGAFSNILRRAVTPSAGAFDAIRAPFAAALSTPIGAAATIAGLAGASALIAAFVSSLISVAIPAAVLGLGAFALLGGREDREKARQDLKDAEEAVEKAQLRAKSGGAAARRALAEARTELAEAQKLVANNKAFDGLDKSLGNIGKTLKEVGIQAAMPLLGPLTTAFNDFAELIRQLGPEFKQIFTTLAPLIQPLSDAFGAFSGEVVRGLVDAMPGFAEVFRTFGEQLPRIGAALGEFFRILGDNSEETSEALGSFVTALVVILPAVAQVLVALTKWYNLMIDIWQAIINGGRAAVNWITGTAVPAIVTGFNAVINFFQSIPGWIGAAFSAIGAFFSNLWTTVSTFVVNIVNSVIGFFVALPGQIMNAVAALPGLLLSFFTSALNAVAYAIGFAIGSIIGMWITLPGKIISAVAALPGLIANVFNTVRSTATSIVTGLINSVVSFFAQLPGRAYSAVVGIISRIQGVLSSARSTAISGANSLVSGLISILTQIPGKAASAVKGIGSAMAGAISAAGGAIRSAGAGLLRALVDGINGLVGWAIGQAKSAIKSVVQGIKDALPGSPVKEGPLTVLNNGYAGRQIVRMITDGIDMEAAKIGTGFTRSLADSLFGLGGLQTATPARGASFANSTGGNAGNVINLGGVQVTFNGAAPENPTAYGAEVAQSIARSLSAAGLAAGR